LIRRVWGYEARVLREIDALNGAVRSVELTTPYVAESHS